MRNVHLNLRQQDLATVTESGGARQRVFRAGRCAASPPPARNPRAFDAAPSEGALDALPPRRPPPSPPSPPHSDHLRVAQEAVHLIPFDPALASPGFRDLRRLKPRTGQAYAELAAELLG
ncbi:hypothetical protein SLNWT_7305 [Streptomyces albus]|uniref:Uncharacterized protein n=1 Tax=Streptomyces albus (strain ATCC 21838 / DSM 41398 / FERM P-419 / JCM 4703 / NBRC 107858) TaxID=1081613 RepID=A0A0B5F9Z4_STRA4|nr:hypothetical protein SLNWT_7305 [Streptomyces albus]